MKIEAAETRLSTAYGKDLILELPGTERVDE